MYHACCENGRFSNRDGYCMLYGTQRISDEDEEEDNV